jgi:RNA polymerase sigma-70 factor (ECF subfamily)
MQEVFLFVFRKAALFDASRATARSWIVQVTYHRAIDRRRYLTSRPGVRPYWAE